MADQIGNIVSVTDLRLIFNSSGQIVGLKVARGGNSGQAGELRVDQVRGTNTTVDPGQYILNTTQDGMTAHAGGGQASGTAITAMTSRFTTVATIGDSATLPVSVAGMDLTVINASANSMNVFPASGEAINALGANNAFAVAAGKTATFYVATAGQWHTLLSA